MAGTEGLQCPDLHLSETLSTELGFTAERLLSDETVRADGTGVHLVLNHVTQLEEVGNTHCGWLVEALASLAVVEIGRAEARQSGLVSPFCQVVELRTIEDRSGKLHAHLLSCCAKDSFENLSEVHS